ncbi:MAG: hypothetical protein NDI60_05080 [Elusimicrobiales bacterium]|nr:hypothetical protein [Elusimicrobiales bacterium]
MANRIIINKLHIPEQFPPYLRKLVLFDRMISAMLWFITAVLAVFLIFFVADNGIGPWSFAGMALLSLCIAANI